MRERMKMLERLAALYMVVEHTHGLALDQARAEVHLAEAKIREQQRAVQRLCEDGFEALRNGESQQWHIGQSQTEFTEWNAAGLHVWRNDRQERMMAAAEIYRASKMQLRQMECLLDDVRGRLQAQDTRREQRIADDGFLSRKRWLQRLRRLT